MAPNEGTVKNIRKYTKILHLKKLLQNMCLNILKLKLTINKKENMQTRKMAPNKGTEKNSKNR